MNRKEIHEIRRTFAINNCTVTKMWGCYVDHEKNKKFIKKDNFLSLPDEVIFKYLDIFKKSLGGTMDKNLLNVEFSQEQEKTDGVQNTFYKLLKDQLSNEGWISDWFDELIESYSYGENYYIIAVYGVYDVPGKTKDGLTMEDASDEVYTYIMCCFCPVKLSKPCLSYDESKNCMGENTRSWNVGTPVNAFLFPAFNDRATDIHSLLYYRKDPEEKQDCFLHDVIGLGTVPSTPKGQKRMFDDVLDMSLGESGNYDVVSAVYEELADYAEEKKTKDEPASLSRDEFRTILTNSGMGSEHLLQFESAYSGTVGPGEQLHVENIVKKKKFEVATDYVKVTMDPYYASKVKVKMLDGKRCIVIDADDSITVNGTPVKRKVK